MKIDFSFETQYGKFADAIILPDDHTFSEAEIEAMKQQRLDNWIAVVSYVPTEEELAEMEALAAQEPPPEE
jgi:hypothetical protein